MMNNVDDNMYGEQRERVRESVDESVDENVDENVTLLDRLTHV